jgi:hypothetical protein
MSVVSETSGDRSLAERGRSLATSGSWGEARAILLQASTSEPLTGDDLELLARAAYMLGRDDDYVAALERAHEVHLAAGAVDRAARCGFFIGLNLMPRGETAAARAGSRGPSGCSTAIDSTAPNAATS